mgnify:CR=1 FL=1
MRPAFSRSLYTEPGTVAGIVSFFPTVVSCQPECKSCFFISFILSFYPSKRANFFLHFRFNRSICSIAPVPQIVKRLLLLYSGKAKNSQNTENSINFSCSFQVKKCNILILNKPIYRTPHRPCVRQSHANAA